MIDPGLSGRVALVTGANQGIGAAIATALAAQGARVLLTHVAQPSDVAEVVTFLASHQARYVTAQLVQMR